MKKIIILLLALLISACSAVKSAETLSSMQTEPTVSETTVAETLTTEVPEDSTQKETETVIETPREETIAPSVVKYPEQKPVPETT